MKPALTRYRVLANIVGVLLIPLVLLAWPRHLFYTEGSDIYELGERINATVGPTHGFVYMIFLLFAFILSRKANWTATFTVTTLLMGTVPVLSFWAERRATRDVLAGLEAEVDAVHADR